MHPEADFGRLHAIGKRRLARLERIADRLVLPSNGEIDALAAHVVIELDNYWGLFVRSHYLSWFLRARTMSGARVTLARAGLPTGFDDAIAVAAQILNGGRRQLRTLRTEPDWHPKYVLLKLSNACGYGGITQLQTAFSVQTTAFDYLHTVRNFYCHRGEETADRLPRIARKLGVRPSRRATDLVLAVPPTQASTILLTWVAEVRIVSELLCA